MNVQSCRLRNKIRKEPTVKMKDVVKEQRQGAFKQMALYFLSYSFSSSSSFFFRFLKWVKLCCLAASKNRVTMHHVKECQHLNRQLIISAQNSLAPGRFFPFI